MSNFKITSEKKFKGIPSVMPGVSNQVVSVKDASFYKGNLSRELKSDTIVLIIPSRVYIDEASCTDVDTKEAEIDDLKTNLKAKSLEWKNKVDEYKESNKPKDAEAARQLHAEGAAIESTIKTKSDAIDRSSYYEHSTKIELDDVAALTTALADTGSLVKADDLFKDESITDL